MEKKSLIQKLKECPPFEPPELTPEQLKRFAEKQKEIFDRLEEEEVSRRQASAEHWHKHKDKPFTL